MESTGLALSRPSLCDRPHVQHVASVSRQRPAQSAARCSHCLSAPASTFHTAPNSSLYNGSIARTRQTRQTRQTLRASYVDMPPPSGRFLDPATTLLNQRVIFLGSQVDDFSADVIISQLLLLDAEDSTQDIKLLINSPGGSVTAGMGIYDAMKLCRADVSTICFGLAASMGAFLLASGTKGKRFCMPNARVMIHQPLGGAQGSAIDVGLQVREMMYQKVKLNKILARSTGKSEEEVEKDTDRDYFMSPLEAVEYGLVDGVLGLDRPDVVAPIGEVKEPPRTKVWDMWEVKEGKARRNLPGESRLVTL